MEITINYNGSTVAKAGSDALTIELFGELFKNLAMQLYGVYLNQQPRTDHVINVTDTPQGP